ncbi:hypothetical protein TIFTF001_031875 [Ficus carica]|uniref:Uncharacterized protein n=1 Tax=Ficus carica TaxID=3494 RepID=A0AA88E265_FICCA|nr:hypothetical protein TIFTF001_031875 [Ficus carica]
MSTTKKLKLHPKKSPSSFPRAPCWKRARALPKKDAQAPPKTELVLSTWKESSSFAQYKALVNGKKKVNSF